MHEDPASEGDDSLAEADGGGRRAEVRPTPEDGDGGEEPGEPEHGGEPVVAAGDGPLQAVEQGEKEIVKGLHLHVRMVVDLDERGGAEGDEDGAQCEGGPRGAEGGVATENAEGDDDDDYGRSEEAGAHREEGEGGGESGGPPSGAPRARKRERDDGCERGDEQPVLLGVETAEHVLPGERETEEDDGEEPEGGGGKVGKEESRKLGKRSRRRGAAEEADGEEPEGGGEGAVHEGVGGGLEAGVPLAVEDGEGEVLEFGEDDAVLVVGGEDVSEEVVVFEPWDDGIVGLRIPLVPVGHGGAEAVKGRPLQAEHDAEEARGIDGDEKVGTRES